MLETPALLNIDFQVPKESFVSNLTAINESFCHTRDLNKCAIEQSLRGSVPKDLNQIFSIPCGYRDRTNRIYFKFIKKKFLKSKKKSFGNFAKILNTLRFFLF